MPLIKQYKTDYYLVGGTAIALWLGHRESIDFDLFTKKNKNQLKTKEKLRLKIATNITLISEGKDQAHFIVNGVKITFFNFPYAIPSKEIISGIKIPSLLTLGAMKAFALGGRAKWKDYVDLFFILKHGIKLHEIIEKANVLFNSNDSTLFNYRNFMEQLMYYDDVSYAEEVIFVGKLHPKDEEVKGFLTKSSLDFLQNNAFR